MLEEIKEIIKLINNDSKILIQLRIEYINKNEYANKYSQIII